MNYDNLTRKDQVLQLLKFHQGEWVDGPELANETVGGSEGLRRLRELIDEGYHIVSRRHPNPSRNIWQYKLMTAAVTSPMARLDDEVIYIPQTPEVLKYHDGPPAISEFKFSKLPSKVSFGEVAICPRCKAKTQKYAFKNLDGKRHKDPTKEKTPCIGCNGWGIVPNKGPVPMVEA